MKTLFLLRHANKIKVKANKWSNAIDKRAMLEWLVTPREIESV